MTVDRAVVTFTEGAADGIVVLRALAAGHQKPSPWLGQPVDKLPTPFGKGASKSVTEGHVLKWNRYRPGLRPPNFHESHDDASPSYRSALVIEDTLHLFVLLAGTHRIADGLDLCEELKAIFASGRNMEIKQVAFSFVFDADQPGHYPRHHPDSRDPDRGGWPTTSTARELRELWFQRRLSSLYNGQPICHGQWSQGPQPVGLFVWSEPQSQAGTLEDLLLPRARDSLGRTLDRAGDWISTERAQDADLLQAPSEAIKAQLTVAAQLRKPGYGLDGLVIGGRSAQMPSEAFEHAQWDPLRQHYAQIPWSTP